MHLKQLQYTLEVAKCKSFSKAAKKLYVSQPSLSTSISSFEEELGLTLFSAHDFGGGADSGGGAGFGAD